jgi:transcriptional regulator with PAS, ATPase and Fis domain
MDLYSAVREKKKVYETLPEFRTTDRHKVKSLPVFEGMVGENREMKKLFRMISTVARYDGTVLIQGESGTGKELVAGAIHNRSKRRFYKYVIVNCAAIPETLMEGTIFGYNKGAFTGATQSYPGKLEAADNGSIFLDDIDSLDIKLQAKLLRTIQEKEFERLGSHRTVKLNIRFIAASNKRIEELVSKGSFREDLYYRLNVLPLYIPPLRQRKDDIPMLVENSIQQFADQYNKPKKRFSQRSMQVLLEHNWPGNVRELQNVVKRMMVLVNKPVIQHEDLSILNLNKDGFSGLTLKAARQRVEKELIVQTLEKVNGKKGEAAKRLGIHRNTLLLKANEYKLKI